MKQIAIVTGAAKGIGLGIAEELCEAGFRVMLLGRSDDVFDQAERLLSEGYEAEGYRCDIADKESVDKTVERIIKKYGEIHVLVNNAGVSRLKRFEDIEDDLLDYIININLKGTWHMTKAVIPHMKKQKYGRIIMMSSVTGAFVCDKGYTAYGMTKAGIIGLTKTIAVEYAEYGITCNAICPGFILTPAVKRSATTTNPEDPEGVIAKIASGVPMNRLGKPREIGALARFLASKDSGYMTGTVNVIDGGSMLPETNAMGF